LQFYAFADLGPHVSAGRVVRYGDAPLLMLQAVSSHFPVACALVMFLGMASLILSGFFAMHTCNVTSGFTSGDRFRVAQLRRTVLAELVRFIIRLLPLGRVCRTEMCAHTRMCAFLVCKPQSQRISRWLLSPHQSASVCLW
jgi:hypothetical protein